MVRRRKEHVALKVHINHSRVHRELPICDHINDLDSQHSGRNHTVYDDCWTLFEIRGSDGKHTCSVHEALGMNLPVERQSLVEYSHQSLCVRAFATYCVGRIFCTKMLVLPTVHRVQL